MEAIPCQVCSAKPCGCSQGPAFVQGLLIGLLFIALGSMLLLTPDTIWQPKGIQEAKQEQHK